MLGFFKLTLEKIVVAKLIGLPLLAIDYFSESFLTSSTAMDIAILIVGSYVASCVAVYLYNRK
jgi:hypothetical protein